MDGVLIVSGNERAAEAFVKLVGAGRFSRTVTVKTADEARRACGESRFGLIIINAPLPDETGDALAVELLKKTSSGIMLVVREELEASYEKKLGAKGVFVIGKPLNRAVFLKGLHFCEAMLARTGVIASENERLQRNIDENRIISRAKGILMEYLSMTEPQAHKYLEKQAMDLRLTKLEVAKNLLSTYDS